MLATAQQTPSAPRWETTMRDADYREAFLYEIAELRRRRDGLRRTADDEAFGYGARHIARVQASEVTRAITIVRRIYRNLDDIERRRAEDYLRACYAETAAVPPPVPLEYYQS
jgi:hypothetical protein